MLNAGLLFGGGTIIILVTIPECRYQTEHVCFGFIEKKTKIRHRCRKRMFNTVERIVRLTEFNMLPVWTGLKNRNSINLPTIRWCKVELNLCALPRVLQSGSCRYTCSCTMCSCRPSHQGALFRAGTAYVLQVYTIY